ncbi:hypothetical protein OG874_22260 [Nocardia sp. NBC_00565]|uniref:hypothetical protein n=1 Tax=Nocardia sp. NBC_00565 TaxID=2975993 RepID=UPI002E81E470|nr:hypothetical protein [Nocardia sp. NBC_00565]WUC07642.1 hypothetical protein OG874_22260 [Nocardia sp. NBC_00565]
MGIDVIVQNMVNGRVEAVGGIASEALFDMISSAPIGSLMRGIHKYADAMCNSYQLGWFLDEISALHPVDDHEQEVISLLREAAESAIR